MAEKSNSPPNKNDKPNHPADLSVETIAAEPEISPSDLTIAPNNRPHSTIENLGEVELSLGPDSHISAFIDNQANNEGNDDIGGEGLGLEVGVGLGINDYDDSWLIDEDWFIDQHDDISFIAPGGSMNHVTGVDGSAEISWDSPWDGEDQSAAWSDAGILVYDGVEVPDDDGFFFDNGAYLGDDEEFDDEFDMMLELSLLEQFGFRPASPEAIENLDSVVLTQENAENECAVCTEQFHIGETAKKLPCSHYYHEDCIITWLGIHHTCPVCRFGLPTDDDPQ